MSLFLCDSCAMLNQLLHRAESGTLRDMCLQRRDAEIAEENAEKKTRKPENAEGRRPSGSQHCGHGALLRWVFYKDRRKFSTSCFCCVLKALYFAITAFASDPELACAAMVATRSLVRPSCRKN